MMVKIRPLEPLHIGARQVSGHEDIGEDKVLAVPPPSTILGLLAYLKFGEGAGSDDPLKALACGRVWGPLVEIKGKLYFQVGESLLDVEDVGRYVEAVKEPGVRPPEIKYKLNIVERPGTMLERELKTVRHLYHVRFSWVEGLGAGERPSPGDIAYVYYVECDKLDELKEVARVGGEDRAALVEVLKEGAVKPKECREGVLLSPLLFYAEGPYARVGVDEGLEEVEEVYGVLKLSAEGEPPRTKAEWPPKVRSIYVGLGYSLRYGLRRAIYQALPPGTVVRLKRPLIAVGLHCERGYGSLLCP